MWSMSMALALFLPLRLCGYMRVTKEAERRGLDVELHGVMLRLNSQLSPVKEEMSNRRSLPIGPVNGLTDSARSLAKVATTLPDQKTNPQGAESPHFERKCRNSGPERGQEQSF
mmetsp:Transcript_8177/g.11595  ORF Transcript_8177/g.11595 Transcript_8177/m.11595 type:complete len:114 (-) Transcript_8177:77-418(-)